MSLRKEIPKSNKKGAAHEAQLKQLNRIAGQIRGISKMIEERRYCIDIINQTKAVRSSLATIEKNIINEHLNHCVDKAVNSKNTKQTKDVMREIKELLNSTRL